MSTYRPIDSKREEFRKYLERAGVMDALTKVLVTLYEEPEKPEDALEFVRTNLGDKRPTAAEVEALKNELDNAIQKIKELEEELAMLRGEIVEEKNDVESKADQGTTDSNASKAPAEH